MLALAEYNLVPSRVKQAVMNTARDERSSSGTSGIVPANALPKQTREYVPKMVAAMIVGRNARLFGF